MHKTFQVGHISAIKTLKRFFGSTAHFSQLL